MKPIMAHGDWTSNAHLIADVARLGYLPGHVLDPTWGRGRWWQVWQPEKLTSHDLFTRDGVDFRYLPESAETFDSIAFDPPYKLNGTPALGDFDNAYGVDVKNDRESKHQCIRDGMTECTRVLRFGGFLLLKCMDQVEGGKVRWQTDIFTTHAVSLGLEKVDSFNFPSYRAQPEGRGQQHARRNFSTLMVFTKGRAC